MSQNLMQFLKAIFFVVLPLTLYSWMLSGCAKEYSFEGGINPDTTQVIADTNGTVNFTLPSCSSCKVDTFGSAVDTWTLDVHTTKACGTFTRTVLAPDKDAFTFFGPSACSIDSGLIINSFWSPLVFNKDYNNISTQRSAFYYYDNIGNTFVLQEKIGTPFTVVIESFTYQTGIAKGHCFGDVITHTGKTVSVKKIRFTIRIPK